MKDFIDALSEMLPSIDFEKEQRLISDGILDSLNLVSIMLMINEKMHIDIPIDDMTTENFDSAQSMFALIERLKS